MCRCTKVPAGGCGESVISGREAHIGEAASDRTRPMLSRSTYGREGRNHHPHGAGLPWVLSLLRGKPTVWAFAAPAVAAGSGSKAVRSVYCCASHNGRSGGLGGRAGRPAPVARSQMRQRRTSSWPALRFHLEIEFRLGLEIGRQSIQKQAASSSSNNRIAFR